MISNLNISFLAAFVDLPCFDNWTDFVRSVAEAFPSKTLLLLFDISSSKINLDPNLLDLFNEFSSVIALTSREAKFSDSNAVVVETMKHFFNLELVKYSLFQKEEVESILNLLKVQIDIEELERRTLFSPVLVMVHLLSEDKKAAALESLQIKFMFRINSC